MVHCVVFHIDVSWVSTATCFKCGAIANDDLVAYLLVNLSVEKMWKSVNIYQSHGQHYNGLFSLTDSVYMRIEAHCNMCEHVAIWEHCVRTSSCFESLLLSAVEGEKYCGIVTCFFCRRMHAETSFSVFVGLSVTFQRNQRSLAADIS